jgi:hypothetical protein
MSCLHRTQTGPAPRKAFRDVVLPNFASVLIGWEKQLQRTERAWKRLALVAIAEFIVIVALTVLCLWLRFGRGL